MLYSLTVPSTVRSYPVPRKTFENRILATLRAVCAITGGATALQSGLGAWIDSRGFLITESVCVVQTYADESARAKLEKLARIMARDYSQDAVLLTVTVDSVPVFISENVA